MLARRGHAHLEKGAAESPMSRVLHKSRVKRGLPWLLDVMVLSRLRSVAAEHVHSRERRMAVFANDYIGSSIFVYGLYEKEELETLFDFLHPLTSSFKTGTALDIGANIGNHSLYFSRRFRNVVAFEPNPDTFILLQFNLSPVENAEVRNCALGQACGSINMIDDTINHGASKISEAGSIAVNMKSLDETFGRDAQICFIKLDVEGFEAEVLRGGMHLIRQCQPIVVLEQNLSDFQNGTTEAIEILRRENYRFCWQENGLENKSRLGRRLTNIANLFIGRSLRIIGGDSVPARAHSMLIAIPSRFQQVLNFQPL